MKAVWIPLDSKLWEGVYKKVWDQSNRRWTVNQQNRLHANSEEKELLSPYLLELLDTHEEDSLNGTVEGMIAARVERTGRLHQLAFRVPLLASKRTKEVVVASSTVASLLFRT